MARPPSTPEAIAASRESLLDTAQTLFDSGGSDAMSFRAIAASAGCSHTKLYSYFDSKADLIDALRIRSYQLLFDRLAAAAGQHTDPIESLRALAEAYIDVGLERPQMYGLLYSDEGQVSETAPALDAKMAAIGICRDAIAAAAEAGQLELAVDPLTAAHLFWAGAHGLLQLQFGGFLVVGCTLDALFPALLTTLIDGLSARQSVPAASGGHAST